MKKIFVGVLFIVGFFSATYAIAQIYEGRAAAITEPMDRVEGQHEQMYANVGSAGDADNAVPQDQRYTNMTDPLDQANERHFNEVRNYETIRELPNDGEIR